MNTFQKAMSTAGIVLTMTSVPVGAAPPQQPAAILPGYTNISLNFAEFEYEYDPKKLSRNEWLKKATDTCANAKGIFHVAGSKASCKLPAKPANNTKSVKQPPPGDEPDALECPPNCLKTANPTNAGKQTK